jgi:alpha-tubulin suppressor-like RCC1 family protein
MLGTLGQGDTDPRTAPVLVPLPRPVLQISISYNVVCAIDDRADLYCWGDNFEGQAGQNDDFASPANSTSPLLVTPTASWRFVAAGQGHVCATTTDGALYCWGRNVNNELGFAGPGQVRTPTQVGTDQDWTTLTMGQAQSCGLKTNGTLFCWGDNRDHQLGMDPPGVVATPTQVGSDSDWSEVVVDTFHGCGLRAGGQLQCWGRREEGQLAGPWDPQPVLVPTLIDPNPGWSDLSVGRFHTCGILAGASYCTGANDDGRIGDGTMERPYALTPVLPL